MRITIFPITLFISAVIISAVIISAVIFLGSCNTAFAYENDIGQSQIHPAHPLYFLKTIREILELKFAGTPRIKILRQLEFSQRRLREVNALIEKSRQDLIETTLERYFFHLNTVLSYRPREEVLTLQIIPVVETHLKVMERIYYQLSNPAVKRAVRAKISKIVEDSNTPISPKVRMDGCNFLFKEASASGLNSTETAVLLERAIKCKRVLEPRF